MTSDQPVSEENNNEEPKKASPAEAFSRLENALWQVHGNVEGISEFIQQVKETLPDDPEEYRREGRLEVFDSLFQLHDFIFTHVTAIETGKTARNSFIVDILKYIENELERHDVYVYRPQIGSKIDLKFMRTLQAVPIDSDEKIDTVARVYRCAFALLFGDKSETVAQVHRCGFAMRLGDKGRILQMADVDVYRRKP